MTMMFFGLYVHDGLRYIRIDQIETIGETIEQRKTDRYSADGGKVVDEATRHVTTLSGGQYSSPGTAADFLAAVDEVVASWSASQKPSDEGE